MSPYDDAWPGIEVLEEDLAATDRHKRDRERAADDDALLLQAEAAHCGMSVAKYLAARRWDTLFLQPRSR